MRSKISFCNGTVIRKNITRFAPLWVSYILCLLVGLFLVYSASDMSPEYPGALWHSFWYSHYLVQTMAVLAFVNVAYGFLVVQLLFGDLYNSRVCNMLHALPLRREGWFVSNVLSGLLFSILPLAVFALAAMLLTVGSAVRNAWQIPLLVFAAANLQYITFFGMALFCAMAVGKRFTMAAAYALMNLGAQIANWAITCVYTPMLYGVRLMEKWAQLLTPAYYMAVSDRFVELEGAHRLNVLYEKGLEPGCAGFTIGDGWGNLMLWATVGVVLMVCALVMYRSRQLERAGDAVAFSFLKPVFLVLCAVFVSTVTYGAPRALIGDDIPTYLLLALGLAVGWFIAKMLVEHTTQVFRLKNWYGLGILGLVMALTLAGTHFDLLNIEGRKPKPEDIVSASVGAYLYDSTYQFTESQDIESILQLHDLALQERPEPGTYILENGEYVLFEDYPSVTKEMEGTGPTDYTEARRLCIRYQLKNGMELVREYTIWQENEAGLIVRDLTSRWEYITGNQNKVMTPEGEYMDSLDFILENFDNLYPEIGSREQDRERQYTREDAMALLEAVKRDCSEGNMSRWGGQQGYFQIPDKYSDTGYSRRSSLYISMEGRIGSGNDYRYGDNYNVRVYPSSRHTLAWMAQKGLLEDVEIFTGKQPLW